MSKKPGFDEQAVHKYFSASCFNQTWDLMDKKQRTSDENVDMLVTAMASLWHWKQRTDVTATNFAIGYWQVARVYALLGKAAEAREYGLLSLDASQQQGVEPFYLGYAHEALARAALVSGEVDLRDYHLKLARATIEKITDQESRKILLDDLATIC